MLSLGNTLNKTIKPTKTLVIDCSADVLIYSFFPDTNYSTYKNIQLMTSILGGDEMWALINFNVGSLTGKNILSAIISIYAENMGADFTIGAKRVTSSWDESTVTYNTIPTYNSTSYNTSIVAGVGWKYLDITNLIKAAAAGSDYYGILLYSTLLNYNWLQLASKEADSGNKPILTVKYRG